MVEQFPGKIHVLDRPAWLLGPGSGSAWLVAAEGVGLGSVLDITACSGPSVSSSTVSGSGRSVTNDGANSSSVKMFALYGKMPVFRKPLAIFILV